MCEVVCVYVASILLYLGLLRSVIRIMTTSPPARKSVFLPWLETRHIYSYDVHFNTLQALLCNSSNVCHAL